MGLIRKEKSEKEPSHRHAKGPVLFTALMVILFGLIVFIMFVLLLIVTTYFDMMSLTSDAQKHHDYYQRQEKKYLGQVCQEYKNMNLALASGLKAGKPVEELVGDINRVCSDSEGYLILDEEGRVVFPEGWDGKDFSERDLTVLTGQKRPLLRMEKGEHRVYYCDGLKDGDHTIVFRDSDSRIDDILYNRTSWAAQCENVEIGSRGMLIPLSKRSGQLYYKPEELAEEELSSLSANRDILGNDSLGILRLQNKSFLYYSGIMPDHDTVLAALVPLSDLMASVSRMTLVCTLIFALAMGFILFYVVTLLRLRKRGERVYRWKKLPGGFIYDRSAGRQMMLYVSLVLPAMAILTYYVQTLAAISVNSARATEQLRQVVTTYDKASHDSEKAEALIKDKRELFLRMVLLLNLENDHLFQDLDDYVNQSDNIYSAIYYDEKGEILYSSDPVSEEMSQDEKKELNDIREEINNNYTMISDVKGGKGTPKYRNLALLTLKGDEATGFVIFKIAENELPGMLRKSLLKDELLSVRMRNRGTAFAIDSKSGTFSFEETGKLIGKDALKYGLKPEDLQSSFSGFLNYNGVRKYAVSVMEQSQYIYLAMEEWGMLIHRLPTVAISLIAGVICIFFLFISVTIKRKAGGESLFGEEAEGEGKARNSAHPAHVVKVIRWGIFSIAVLVTLTHLLYDVLLPETSILYYIFEGNWEKGLNIFSYTMCLVTICESYVLIILVSRLLEMVAGSLSRRAETVCRLLTSLIKYLGILVVIFLCIANCGVNMRTLTVSAGIMGTVLGLGATSLLSDIFAGLFMTFEGDMQVGDAMIIDGFLGRIVEIGIRTTKFIDTDESILIVNNHMLMGPVKRARTYNYCHSYINMDYDESLDRVEAFLAAELPGLMKKLPFLLAEPEYRGVVSLLDQHVQIDIRYRASAADRFMAEREMNRELKLLFDKYHLSLNITEDYRMTDIVYLPAGEGDAEASQEYMESRWKERSR